MINLRVEVSSIQLLIIWAFCAITYNAGSAIEVENQTKNQKITSNIKFFLLEKLFVNLSHIGKIQYCNHIKKILSHTDTILSQIAVSFQFSGTDLIINNWKNNTTNIIGVKSLNDSL